MENLEAGSEIDEIIEQFHVTREQVRAVFEFAARSLDVPAPFQRIRFDWCAFSLTTAPRAA
ncbi:MAG: DUF433 domain-containing protein [Acidobacteriota bacterium]|nr:DUF433 domain-containing protein [Acidobacteriota bacterium]